MEQSPRSLRWSASSAVTCIDMGATSILVALLVTLLVTRNPGLENLGVVDRYESWMSVDVKVWMFDLFDRSERKYHIKYLTDIILIYTLAMKYSCSLTRSLNFFQKSKICKIMKYVKIQHDMDKWSLRSFKYVPESSFVPIYVDYTGIFNF